MTYIPPEPLHYNFCPTCGGSLAAEDDGERHRPHCIQCRRFFYHNPVPATCCFVRRADGALLLVKRGVEPCKGEWSLPGGFMEVGENAEESARRELLEETGLHGGRFRLIGASARPSAASGAILVLGYLVEDWEGTLCAGSDVAEARFYADDERPNLVFTVHRELLEGYDALFV